MPGPRLAARRPLIAWLLVVGCTPDYVEPPATDPTLTDGGYGETGDDAEAHVCWAEDAAPRAVRWQCEGLAEAAVLFTVSGDVEIPRWVGKASRRLIEVMIDYGRVDWNELFGPWDDEGYDAPGVAACCLPTIPGADAPRSSADGAGMPAPGHDHEHPEEPEDPWVPQPAAACADDCADQACRQMIRELRAQAEELPWSVYAAGEPVRAQLVAISNWLATGQPCFDAMKANGVSPHYGSYVIRGAVELPTDARWPAFTALSVEGKCTINDWYLPEGDEAHGCMGLGDNDGEAPFGIDAPMPTATLAAREP